MRSRILVYITITFLLLKCVPAEHEHQANDSLGFEQDFNVLKDPKYFTVKEDLKIRKVPLFGKSRDLYKMITAFYTPDQYTSAGPDDANPPEYIITDAELIQGTFLSDSGRCEERSILLCSRGDYVDEEYYDLFFLAADQGKNIVLSGMETFDGSQGEYSTELEMSLIPLPVNKNCSLLAVTSTTERGEPDLFKEQWIEILVANGRGFRSLFRLQLEETAINEYDAIEEESQRSLSKVQQYEILSTSSNGLYDIKVMYTLTENGAVTKAGEEYYRFDGRYYVNQ